jgi:pimeloyl-ACP methyl ester carboxylesterase
MEVARWLDRGIALAVSLPKMFGEGWGDPDVLTELLERTDTFGPPAPIDVHFRPGRRRIDGLHVFEGFFESPDMGLPLPPESRTAYFQLVLPRGAFNGQLPPVCIHLAGSGDATYTGRRILSAPLARSKGIGALILQNPYYGERKPADQYGTKLNRVTDQFLMNIATIEEARSLLRWLREDGYPYVGITGYSMGGYVSALTAQLTDFPIAAIPCAAGNTVIDPVVFSPLSRIYDWEQLQRELDEEMSARELMAEIMGRFAIDRHGDLKHPELAVLLGSIRDEFIPPGEVVALHNHWSGSELRWIDAGHTTGWALHGEEIRDAIATAFRRLQSAH